MIRAIVHTASAELQSGRLSDAAVEETMLATVFAAMAEPAATAPRTRRGPR